MSIAAYIDCEDCCDVGDATEAVGSFRKLLRDRMAERGWITTWRNGKMIDLCRDCARKSEEPAHGSE